MRDDAQPRLAATRRRLLVGAGVSTLLPLARPVLSQGARPLRIGMVTSLSGPFTALGESMRAGMQLLLSQSGNSMAGRSVEFLVEDDAARPEDGVRKARKLIGQDRVDVICGVISSGVALALRDVVTEAKVPTFLLGSANDLARKAASPYIVRPTKTNWMLGHTAARWAYDKVSKARVLTVGSDYAAGREYVGDFVQTFQQLGGRLGRQLWTPLGSADFGPLLTTIASERPDMVFGFFAGSDAVRFLRQWKEYRLAGRIPLVGPGAFFDQEDVLPAVGDAALGAVNAFNQSPTAPASANFNRAYMAAGKPLPGEFSTNGYVCGQTIKAVLERVEGDLSDWEKARAALFAEPVDTAFGRIPFDPRNGQAILDIHVNEVRRSADGKMINTVVHTYESVRDPGPDA
ncbi:branched-chain amino acid transport system substrate-binding protein [Roseomonas rosea]|uniref:Branched-chain amino acid transport system substrate-binding protein n=1 Tax=Muricoccus roseus TaxID=198092 RepID=A0A1M6IYP7_9PROT|nr:ABC transporter substrate-binding protein [Roseomonas rosea]SHJ39497.1 branched-chain amino acid transport system substrate-binding protein [Roseomonas rosea]